VITGSTEGIGKAMALKLADKGLNIALLSRS
jgi:short-subunit dehydrogenase